MALSVAPFIHAQHQPAEVIGAPVETVKAYTLEDCIQTGLANQPSMRAAQASLGAAIAQRDSLQNLRIAGIVSREIPIRRKQSELGVTIASANLSNIEWETTYTITRSYFTVIYARKQLAVVNQVTDDLKKGLEKAKFLIKLGDPDVVVTQVDVDKLNVYIDLVKTKVIEAEQGVQRATAALREAMGLEQHCPLIIAETDLPSPETDLSKQQMIDLALSRKGAMIQVSAAADVLCLEVAAQNVIHRTTANTFASAADIHATPVPQGDFGKEYRPWAVGIEMPTMLVGHRADRVRRAKEFHARGLAVVDKTRQLVVLEATDAYLRWQEAAKKLQALNNTPKTTAKLLKSITDSFQIGKVTGQDFLETQVLDAQVRAQLNEASFDHANALATLERLTAGGFVPSYRRIIVHHHP